MREQSEALAPGLRFEKTGSAYRCAHCGKMQRADPGLVWVPDGVALGDPAWSVTEQCRRVAYNGDWSGWCLECARKLGRQSVFGRIRAALALATA